MIAAEATQSGVATIAKALPVNGIGPRCSTIGGLGGHVVGEVAMRGGEVVERAEVGRLGRLIGTEECWACYGTCVGRVTGRIQRSS